ncbi:MAG: HVO_2523 family zinc finger protein [Halorientalis sp.]
MDEARASEGTDETASDDELGGRPCPRCERPMYSRHCKYVCPVHGVIFDCADTFY